MCPPVKRWQPSIYGMATSTTAGHEVPTPVLTATGNAPLPSAGEGLGGGKSLGA